MACVLTSDFNLDCAGSMGGAKTAFFMEHANLASVTITDGVVTALTKAPGKRFFKYQLPRETGFGQATLNSNEQTGALFFNHEVKIVINKLSAQIRNEILLLAKNRLVVVIEDNNGKFWMFGKHAGLVVTNGVIGTGTASADRNGADLDFATQEPELQLEVSAEVAEELTTPEPSEG